jgi:hypothetical protein
MNSLLRVTKSIKKLLVEVDLKTAIGHLKNGDKVQLSLADNGGDHMFTVDDVDNGNVIMGLEDGGKYTFSIEDYADDALRVYSYDEVERKRGKSTLYPLKSLSIGTQHGRVYTYGPNSNDGEDPVDDLDKFEPMKNDEKPEDEDPKVDPVDDLDKFEPMKNDEERLKEDVITNNETILSAKVGDNIHFSIRIHKDGEDIEDDNSDDNSDDNNVVLEVTNIIDNYIDCHLEDINGPISAALEERLNNKNLVIDKNNLTKIEKGKVVLDILIKNENKRSTTIQLPSIKYVGINEYEHRNEDGEKNTLSKQELDKIMYNNKALANYWLKSPGAVQALFGATPAGRYTIAQQMKKLNVANSYLTKGNKVRFGIIRPRTLVGTREKNLKDMNKKPEGYTGKMINSTTMIVWGSIDKTHWKVKFDTKRKADQYEVTFEYYTDRETMKNKDEGIIKIFNIWNPREKSKNNY